MIAMLGEAFYGYFPSLFGEKVCTRTVVLNLFWAVAHFEEPQIFVAQFLVVANFFHVPWPTSRNQSFMAHFVSIWDVMVIKLKRLASKHMAAEVISKKKGQRLPSAQDGQSVIYKGK